MSAICADSGKECLSRSDAERKIRELQACWPKHRLTPDADADTLNAYRCRWCERWHIGHQFSSIRRHKR